MILIIVNMAYQYLYDLFAPFVDYLDDIVSFLYVLWELVYQYLYDGAYIVQYFVPYFLVNTFFPVVIVLEGIFLSLTCVMMILKFVKTIPFL